MKLTDLTKPVNATHAIVAEFETDACDYQSDYFAAQTRARVFLGWSTHGRDLFPELRKAAATFAETAALATAGKDAEHREKWSMGAGYYLKSAGRYDTGWKIRKVDPGWYTDEVATVATYAAPPVSAPANGYANSETAYGRTVGYPLAVKVF